MKNGSELNNLLTLRQACKVLNVHPDTLRRWEKQNKLTAVRVGARRDRRYRLPDIYSLIDVSLENQQEDFDNKKLLIEKRSDLITIRELIGNAKIIMLDVSETLMSLFPSRGIVYANIALEHGYNLIPSIIEENYDKQYNEWEKEKLFSIYGVNASVSERNLLFKKLNSDILIKSGIPEIDRSKAEEISEKIFLEVRRNPENWAINTGVLEFIDTMVRQRKYLAVVDNWDENLHEFIRKTKFGAQISLVISGGELQHRKPDPYIFDFTLKRTGFRHEDAVYIGNRKIDDAIGASKAKITPIIYDPSRQYLNEDFLCFYRFKDLI